MNKKQRSLAKVFRGIAHSADRHRNEALLTLKISLPPKPEELVAVVLTDKQKLLIKAKKYMKYDARLKAIVLKYLSGKFMSDDAKEVIEASINRVKSALP